MLELLHVLSDKCILMYPLLAILQSDIDSTELSASSGMKALSCRILYFNIKLMQSMNDPAPNRLQGEFGS